MKKCVFIVPYFGKLPNTFQMFLRSCKANPSFNWIIFTDDNTNYQYPTNVKKIDMTFNELTSLIQSKFDFPISLKKPNKLCDFKPTYGFIFKKYINGYDFWGECDLDIIFGNMDHFISDELLSNYDKIFDLGHCILYRNDPKINLMFKKPINNQYWYKKVLSSEKIYGFDETWSSYKNINTIFLNYGLKVFEKSYAFDVSNIPFTFNNVKYEYNSRSFWIEKGQTRHSLCVWESGNLYRYLQARSSKLSCQEYLYIHFQDRNMIVEKSALSATKVKIILDYIAPLEVNEILNSNFNSIKKINPNVVTLKHSVSYVIQFLGHIIKGAICKWIKN